MHLRLQRINILPLIAFAGLLFILLFDLNILFAFIPFIFLLSYVVYFKKDAARAHAHLLATTLVFTFLLSLVDPDARSVADVLSFPWIFVTIVFGIATFSVLSLIKIYSANRYMENLLLVGFVIGGTACRTIQGNLQLYQTLFFFIIFLLYIYGAYYAARLVSRKF